MDKEFYTWKGIKFKAVPDSPRGGCNECAFYKVPALRQGHPCAGDEQLAQVGATCYESHGHYDAA